MNAHADERLADQFPPVPGRAASETMKQSPDPVEGPPSRAGTLTIEAANGVRYAYQRFGPASMGAPPLLLLEHFPSTVDGRDLVLLDELATTREVVVFDNAGADSSTGAVPRTFTAAARDSLEFLDALGLQEIDLFGYALGAYVGQELILLRPELTRSHLLVVDPGDEMDGSYSLALRFARRSLLDGGSNS